jgi:hypothetical protein
MADKIQLDFLSDPGAAVKAIRQVEVALMRLDSRIGGLGVSFQLLQRNMPTSDMTKGIDQCRHLLPICTEPHRRAPS